MQQNRSNAVIEILRFANSRTAQYVVDPDCIIQPGEQYVNYIIQWSVLADSRMTNGSEKQLKRCINDIQGIVTKLSAEQQHIDVYNAGKMKLELYWINDLLKQLDRHPDTIQWNGVLGFLLPVWSYVSQYPETYDLINTILDFSGLHTSPRALAEVTKAVAAVTASWPE